MTIGNDPSSQPVQVKRREFVLSVLSTAAAGGVANAAPVQSQP
ncbi:(2Fe-2S)-binding protein, partial [Acinetobacter baumannii]|nr:(2Fe-2S)-binding protein [Acinetobacter baumannii]